MADRDGPNLTAALLLLATSILALLLAFCGVPVLMWLGEAIK
jgi:hypothetical protein